MAKYDQWPDPRNSSENSPAILLSPEEAKKVFLSDTNNKEIPRYIDDWQHWWKREIQGSGWHHVEFFGQQVLLSVFNQRREYSSGTQVKL